MPSPAQKIQSIKNAAIALSTQSGKYLTKAQMLKNFPFPFEGRFYSESSVGGVYIKRFVNQVPESSFCMHSLSPGTVVNLCYEVVPESTQSPGGLTIEGVPGCTSLIDNTTIGCRAAFSITCNGALKVSEAAYYIHSGGLGDECVVAGRRDMGASSASGIVKEMGTSNEVTHTVLNRNMAIEQFTEQAALSGLEREDFVALIKREGIEFNGGNYTMENSPETFVWFLKILDQTKDWPEPKQASIVVPAPVDINASQTDEPTTSPEQETSSVQGTGVSQQPTETISTAMTQAPSTSEQGEPLEPAVENASNITNSKPKATELEQGTPEAQPTGAVTEEPQSPESTEVPEQEPSVTTTPQGTNNSKTEQDKQEESEPTQAPTTGLATNSEGEDTSSEQIELTLPYQARALDFIIPILTVLVIGGVSFCLLAPRGTCSGLLSGLFRRGSSNEEQTTATQFDSTVSMDNAPPLTLSLSVEPTPENSPGSTPTVGKVHYHHTEASRHPLNRLQFLRKNTFGLDSPKDGSPGPDSPRSSFSMLPKSVVQKQAVVGSYNSDPEPVKVVGMAEWGTDALEVRLYEDQ